MNPSIAGKLEQISRRLAELDRLLSAETATADMDAYRRLTREHAEIAPVVALYEAYRRGADDVSADGLDRVTADLLANSKPALDAVRIYHRADAASRRRARTSTSS